MADSGTLLLDEVSELYPAAQVNLLRFLEEREFYPVGVAPRRKGGPVIAATNKSLATQVQAGTFSQRPLLPVECRSVLLRLCWKERPILFR